MLVGRGSGPLYKIGENGERISVSISGVPFEDISQKKLGIIPEERRSKNNQNLTHSSVVQVDQRSSSKIQHSLEEYTVRVKIYHDKGLDPGDLWVNEFVVAGLTGWSLSKLRSDRSQGKETIPHVKRGRKVFYQIRDIKTYMEAYKITGKIVVEQ